MAASDHHPLEEPVGMNPSISSPEAHILLRTYLGLALQGTSSAYFWQVFWADMVVELEQLARVTFGEAPCWSDTEHTSCQCDMCATCEAGRVVR